MAEKKVKARNLSIDTRESVAAPIKGTYRVFNGTSYDTYYLKTSADQVLETDDRKFVTPSEKAAWTSKADGNHTHANYAEKENVFTKQEVTNFLADKANATHTHEASDVTTDETHRFVTDAEKTKWNDTFSTEHINSLETEIKGSIKTLKDDNTADHAAIRSEFAAADTALDGKVTTVQGNLDKAVEDLTELINNGGSANTELAKRVDTIEKTTIPAVQKSVSTLDNKFLGITNELASNKAEKTDVAATVSSLEGKINAKADITALTSGLATKADAATTYNKTEVDSKLSAKVDTNTYTAGLATKADVTFVNTELGKKVSTSTYITDMAKKANITDVDEKLELKAELVHTHTDADITGLGTAATKNVGTSAGAVPILDSQGKLATSILPAIAINETFTAETPEKAMELVMQTGDILILGEASQIAAKDAAPTTITYSVGKPRSTKQMSDEYNLYIASGKLTYLCVDPSDETFEGRFKPLQSSSDTMSRGEIEAELNKKLNNTDFNSFKSENTAAIAKKANIADVFNKTEITDKLGTKVDKVEGKGLSSNDFTDDALNKLNGIEENANNYVHPDQDGTKHVPATGTASNGKVLMAGASAGSMTWSKLNAGHIDATAERLWLTPANVSKWDSKAEGNHNHNDIYRTLVDSYSKTETETLVNKMKTIISSIAPSAGVQLPGAVWIEVAAE